MDEADLPRYPPGTRLKFTLPRRQTRLTQIGCTLFLTSLFGGLGYALVREGGAWLMYVVGGAFLLFALLLAYATVHQVFALQTKQTRVEISTNALVRGERVQFFFQQAGPVQLESLRANLVGEERKRPPGKKADVVTYLGTFNFFDQGAVDIEGTSPLERTATLHVPESIPASLRVPGHSIAWKIEVWGKVRGRADFQHVYDVTIV